MTRPFARRALALARRAARAAGLDPTGAALVRVASAVTVELPAAGAVARVEPPPDLDAARRQAVVARLLEQRGVPAVRLLAGELQPWLEPEGAVTLWRRLEILAGTPSPVQLGRLARRLHDAFRDAVPAEAPDLNPFAPALVWLGRRCQTPPPDGIGRLSERLARLRARWRETVAADPLGTTLVHGDLNADNAVLTPGGPVLLDLEMTGRGPASWDLVARDTEVRRYGAPVAALRGFLAGYGAELPDWPGLELLREACDLNLAAWAIGHRDLSPELAEQAAIRAAALLGTDDRPWTLV